MTTDKMPPVLKYPPDPRYGGKEKWEAWTEALEGLESGSEARDLDQSLEFIRRAVGLRMTWHDIVHATIDCGRCVTCSPDDPPYLELSSKIEVFTGSPIRAWEEASRIRSEIRQIAHDHCHEIDTVTPADFRAAEAACDLYKIDAKLGLDCLWSLTRGHKLREDVLKLLAERDHPGAMRIRTLYRQGAAWHEITAAYIEETEIDGRKRKNRTGCTYKLGGVM